MKEKNTTDKKAKRSDGSREEDLFDLEKLKLSQNFAGTYRELNKGTFGEYINHWRETHLLVTAYKPSTLNSYLSGLEKWILPEFALYPIAAISSAEINRFSAKLQRKLSAYSTIHTLTLLGKIFKDAISDNYIRHTPMEGVRKPKAPNEKHGRALSPEQIQSLLAVLDPETKLQALTAILTGMRQGEEFGLHWEDVDWDNGVINVRRELYWRWGKYHDLEPGEPAYIFVTPKSKKSIREIDMSPGLRKELRQLYLKSTKKGLIFCTAKGLPLNANNIYFRKFKPALKAAGIEGRFRWHDLRHTYGSLKLAQGESIYYVMRQMGHSSIQVTVDVYGHLLESRKPAAAAKTDVMVFGKR